MKSKPWLRAQLKIYPSKARPPLTRSADKKLNTARHSGIFHFQPINKDLYLSGFQAAATSDNLHFIFALRPPSLSLSVSPSLSIHRPARLPWPRAKSGPIDHQSVTGGLQPSRTAVLLPRPPTNIGLRSVRFVISLLAQAHLPALFVPRHAIEACQENGGVKHVHFTTSLQPASERAIRKRRYI